MLAMTVKVKKKKKRKKRSTNTLSIPLGNLRLGRKLIRTFSIPAGSTCPGKSDLCTKLCYASKGFYLTPDVRRSYLKNLRISKTDKFVPLMIEAIRENNTIVFRIHVSGDFYDVIYTRKWIEIVRSLPNVKFFAYTRSWRKPNILVALKELAALPNIRLWWSADDETGQPGDVPTGVKVAYLMTSPTDIPSWGPDLFFRDDSARKVIQKQIGGILVCPKENGVTETTCEKCQICWIELMASLAKRSIRFSTVVSPAATRIQLPVVV